MFFVIGAVGGIASILWKLGEIILMRPSITTSTGLKSDNSNIVILKVTNNNGRRPVDLIRTGFIFSNGDKIDITKHGYVVGWCFRGQPTEVEIGINVFKNKMREQGDSIVAMYLSDENDKTYEVTIPEYVKRQIFG